MREKFVVNTKRGTTRLEVKLFSSMAILFNVLPPNKNVKTSSSICVAKRYENSEWMILCKLDVAVIDNYGQTVLQGSTLVNIDKRDCRYRKRFGFQSPHLHLIQVIGFGSNCFCPEGLKLGQRNCELSYRACSVYKALYYRFSVKPP